MPQGGAVHELGPLFQHRAKLGDVAVPGSVLEPLDSDTVHEGSQFRPTVEPVCTREDELCIMQCKRQRTCVAVVCMDLRDGGGISRSKCCKQFLRLAFELIKIRMLAKLASGQAAIHNELLSPRLRYPRQPLYPVSARSGRKEFGQNDSVGLQSSGGRSPSRGHGGVLKRQGHHIMRLPMAREPAQR
jgi:hypothetical protein